MVEINPLSAIYDGYIRHQNDHLSGRMMVISVMGEWQVAGVGGTRPLRNVLGEASQRTIFVRSSKISLFFPELCSFRRVFFVSRAFVKFGAKRSSSGAFAKFWFRRCLGAFFENSAHHRAFFANSESDHEYFLKICYFFQSRAGVTCLIAMVISRLSKALCDGTSKTRMKTWRVPGVGQIERRRIVDRRRDRYEWLAVIHCPKEKKHSESECDWAKYQPFIVHKTSEFWGACFRDPMSLPFCILLFSCPAAGRSGCSAGTAKRSSHPWHFRCWSPKRNELECNLSAPIWFTGQRHCTVFRHVMQLSVVGSVLESTLTVILPKNQEKEINFKRWPPG